MAKYTGKINKVGGLGCNRCQYQRENYEDTCIVRCAYNANKQEETKGIWKD